MSDSRVPEYQVGVPDTGQDQQPGSSTDDEYGPDEGVNTDAWAGVPFDFPDDQPDGEDGPESDDAPGDAGLSDATGDAEPSDASGDAGPPDAGETASEASYRLLNDKLDDVLARLSECERGLRGPEPPPDVAEQLAVQRELVDEVRKLRIAVEELVAGGRGQDPAAAVAASAQASVIRSEAKMAHRRWGGAWDAVWAAVKRALRRLWEVISHLLTVKEWTVTGQAKSDPFGLVSASVTITFGK